MELLKLEIKQDKNSNDYLVAHYLDKKGKERKVLLNHYDLEYAMKGKIKYESSRKETK